MAKTPAQRLTVSSADVPQETEEQRLALMFPDIDDKNKILGTLRNLRFLLEQNGIICRYNIVSKRNEIIIPGETFSRENIEDASLACIYSLMKKNRMPVDGYEMYLLRIADENQYNPIMEWITSKPWDGVDRLTALYATIESPEEEAKNLIIRRWLITAVCMARGEGVDSAGCLVLQGPQDIGKTWWVKKLVPEEFRDRFIRTDASVDPHDKDSVSQIISYWIVELGEIGATFAKAELQALKGFITSNQDIMRRPYGKGDKHYPRRTALIASVDQTIFLHDTAGNRRFMTIPCTAINSYHNIDMQQLWAQVLSLVEGGETWRLEPNEKAHIARINSGHTNIDPLIEMIKAKYDVTQTGNNWMSATDIASAIGCRNITQRETRIISSYMKDAGFETRISRGFTQYRVEKSGDGGGWY